MEQCGVKLDRWYGDIFHDVIIATKDTIMSLPRGTKSTKPKL